MPRLIDTSLHFFRGRPSKGTPRRSEDMGPPSNGAHVSAGRYNQQGQGVLYLCDCENGVLRELSGSPRLDIQRFLLPLSGLVIADFAATPADTLDRRPF